MTEPIQPTKRAQPIQRRKCTARSSKTGLPCGNWPIPGSTVCRYHGGSAPRVKAAAARNTADQDTRHILGRLQHAPVTNPLEALSELAGEVLAWKNLLADRVADLTSTGYAGKVAEQVRADVVLFTAALDQARKILVDMSRLGIEERLIRITEEQSHLIVSVIDGALDAGDLTPIQRNAIRRELARRLRAVDAAQRVTTPAIEGSTV